jgi:DNA-binding NarL/FixJ family response regulator
MLCPDSGGLIVSTLVKFLIVDDHPIFRHGMACLIESDPRYRVIAQAGSAAEALERVEVELPDIAVIDISLGKDSGLDLLKELHARHPEIRSLVVSIHDEAVYARRALRAHARGYLMKHETSSALREAIDTIMEGKIYVSSSFRESFLEQIVASKHRDADHARTEILSDRELEVLRRMGQGYGAIEIADSLAISVKTVGVYQERIKKKLSLASTAELRKYAVQWFQNL